MTAHPVSTAALLAYACRFSRPRHAAMITAHVAVCPACAATLTWVALVRATVRADAVLAPSAAAVARVAALAAGRTRPAAGAAPPCPSIAPLPFDDQPAAF